MGVSPKDTASQQRNPERVSKDQRGSAALMRFGYKQIIPVLAAGAAAVAIAAAPTAMAEPAAVQQPATSATPVAADAGWHGGGCGGGWHGGGWGGGGWQAAAAGTAARAGTAGGWHGGGW